LTKLNNISYIDNTQGHVFCPLLTALIHSGGTALYLLLYNMSR